MSLRKPLRKPCFLQLRLSNLLHPRSFLPLPRPLKSLARLVTKGGGRKWQKVRRLTKAGPSQRTKVRARKPLSRRRGPIWLSPRLWPKRRRLLILPSSHWLAKKTLPQQRLTLGFFSFSLCIFSLGSFFLSLYLFLSG